MINARIKTTLVQKQQTLLFGFGIKLFHLFRNITGRYQMLAVL